MFEFFVALRYIVPRKRSLSTSLVFLLSVGVISLVVWLVLVFLSVTTGIERNWLHKLTSLHAPIRITPSERYYQSYYYHADAFASASNYALKTIGEKAEALHTDPYRSEVDAELPLVKDTGDRDLVKELYAVLAELKLPYQDYELTGALLRLNTHRGVVLSQMSFLLSLTENNPNFSSLLLPLSEEDRSVPHVAVVEGRCSLPPIVQAEPVLLPKSYRESGVHVGDRGSLHFSAPGASSMQEQCVSIQIVGFYDPGLFAVGGRCIIVPHHLTRTIHAASQVFSPDGTPSNGIFVWCGLDEEEVIRANIQDALERSSLSPFWNLSSYKDFEFSKDLFQQFRSDRTLFLMIAVLILLVACCNVISLLILLVQEKKREIAILVAMGASRSSVATIFGFCGLMTGMLSTVLGTLAALFTLRHLDVIVRFLSALQGHAAFHPLFFGTSLPNQLSREAFLFICVVTPLLSLLAGLIPALRASRIEPAIALRQE